LIRIINETRFWVKKIPVLEQEETNFLENLIQEIPGFMYFLYNRKLSSEHATRMWFTAQQIKTKALFKLVQNNRNRVEKELASILLSVMEKFDLETINLCPTDALAALNKTRVKTDLTQLRDVLKMNWKLENQKNSNSYQKFEIWSNGDIAFTNSKGRYYTIEKTFLTQNFDETMTA
tara:strand:+ start:29 stop:559 length:531 start_codon:yes stop_codon:yes gene_type:complete